MKRSKSYRQADEQIDRSKFYSPAEAVAIAKAGKVTKFDPTVEVALRLGVDPRKQDQMVRGTVNLPNGTGKTARVLAFAIGDRDEVIRLKPAAAKGRYVKKVTFTTTMGPGIPVDPNKTRNFTEDLAEATA